jgi:uncharacterized repeat protein (TIGR01451 family)
VPPNAVDVSITKTAKPANVAVGAEVRFDERITNAGPGDAHNVAVTDPLPAGLEFVSVTTNQGSCSGGTIITCLIGSLPAHTNATVTIHARANRPGTLVNHATVTTTDPDSNLANNAAQATVTVSSPFVPPKTTKQPAKNEPHKTTTTNTTPHYAG